ncbi:MAG: 1,4-dihydroxy-2-naphthoate octaprenyltransferase [Duncaniella sp.]|uniref:1,4-dihydroxy-2-naphthoate octaprenyltransferase n=1 Tax=Duncaniella sp. TaxID=2518496 RepID=UPI0023D2CA71|nr:1,4-dihydroxy-2-naphthoate octaprenyltransferase [Duncaniella sp.]MDE6090324.1 1,4-dihydroxy-2-naphthoate octaprenyltransferase [Duncaniella sp.]
MGRSKAACWIEAMRLRTLPVSLAGVIYSVGLGLATWHFSLVPAILCLVFALLAQIASNFANEYYDFKRGFDRVGREGPRRGVTEGDITPAAMKRATFATLGVACAVGCLLVALYGEWWMYVAGVMIALGVMAYSTGPYPLSHHGLGEIAVICFFGIVPVCLTYMLMGGLWGWWLFAAAAGIGLMGANVLIVNNYRDVEDDRSVGKHTLAVILGRRAMRAVYFANGILALILTLPGWLASSQLWWLVPAIYLVGHTALWLRLGQLDGARLNPLLGMTAVLMLVYAVGFLLTVVLS